MSVLKGYLLHAEPARVAAAINTQMRFRLLAPEYAKFRSPFPTCILLYVRHSRGDSSMVLPLNFTQHSIKQTRKLR